MVWAVKKEATEDLLRKKSHQGIAKILRKGVLYGLRIFHIKRLRKQPIVAVKL